MVSMQLQEALQACPGLFDYTRQVIIHGNQPTADRRVQAALLRCSAEVPVLSVPIVFGLDWPILSETTDPRAKLVFSFHRF